MMGMKSVISITRVENLPPCEIKLDIKKKKKKYPWDSEIKLHV